MQAHDQTLAMKASVQPEQQTTQLAPPSLTAEAGSRVSSPAPSAIGDESMSRANSPKPSTLSVPAIATAPSPGALAKDPRSDEEISFESSKVPLDLAVLESLSAVGSEDRTKKLAQNIFIVGGTARLVNMAWGLQSRFVRSLSGGYG